MSGVPRRRPETGFRLNGGYVALIALMASSLVLWTLAPNYFRTANLTAEARTALPVVCIAVGQMVVVAARGIDLSQGPMLTLCATGVVALTGAGFPLVGVVICTLAAGMAAGAFNGVLICLCRLQPVVATFTTSFVWAGAALWLLPQPGGTVHEIVVAFIRGGFGLSTPALLVCGMAALWLLFRRTTAFRRLMAAGSDPDAARMTGISVGLVQFYSFVFSGLTAALGGLALAGDVASGDPLIANSLTLPAIVAVVIGGTRLTGGSATFLGTVVGVSMLIVLRNILYAVGLPFAWQPAMDGVLILAALVVARLLIRQGNVE